MKIGRSLVALAALAAAATLAGACASTAGFRPSGRTEPLRQLNLRHGHLGWDGLHTGMTFREVEASVGRRLPVPTSPAGAGVDCSHMALRTKLLGADLELEFSGSSEESRLVAMTVILADPSDPRSRPLDPGELKAAVKTLVPGLQFVPSPQLPHQTEESADKAVYRAPDGEFVFVDPERGVYFGQVCLD